MNKILINLILSITIIANMWVFPVQAEEDSVFDAQTVSEDLNNEESSENPGEETIIDNDYETISEKETTDEVVLSEETGDEVGTLVATEEELTPEDAAEEPTDGESERTGVATEEELTPEDVAEEPTDGESERTGVATEEELTPEDVAEEPIDGEKEGTGVATEEELTPEDAAEEAIDGEGEEIEESQPEDSTVGMTEVPLSDLADQPEPQTPPAAPGTEDKTENADTTTPAVVYLRPVINSISTDGTSITLEWDNAEGALFQIYRWNIIPYVIGTSTTGSFVDTDVRYNRSYTYFIATNSPAYRYSYSQTVSMTVRRPIVDIDEWYKIGEDLAWSPAEREKGGNSLVISGKGSMPDYSSPLETPWHDIAGEIRHISIDDGVTYVGDHTFSDMGELKEVSLPSSVREYGHEVFRGSDNLEFFNHDSAVDGEQLHIAVQYLMGVYSGDTFEPEVFVRKGTDVEGFDKMPELIRGRDYIITYNNTTEVGDGTIEVTFIGDYADSGSVVIPFIVVSDLQENEKTKTVTSIELLPASSTYTGTAQHPDVIVWGGRWTLKEGVDYILTYPDMVDVGTYTVTAQGIGAYSGEVQAIYTILEQKHSEDPKPQPVNPSDPNEDKKPGTDDNNPKETEKERTDPKEEKTEKDKEKDTEKEAREAEAKPEREEVTEAEAEPEREEVTEAETESEKEEVKEAEIESEKEEVTEAETESGKEEPTETATKPVKNLASLFSGFNNNSGDGSPGNGGLSLGGSLVGNNYNPVKFFVGAVGVVSSICAGVYLWFFYRFLHGM